MEPRPSNIIEFRSDRRRASRLVTLTELMEGIRRKRAVVALSHG